MNLLLSKINADWIKFYGLQYHDLEGIDTIEDLKDTKHAEAMGQAIIDRMSRGDVPLNLLITSMMTNAYLYTGDEKYKQWVQDYVEAWWDRTKQNQGVLSDNIGCSGIIGEHTGGKWYGGYYGWTWPHGWLSMGPAVVAAAENAMLLFQDKEYLDFPRSQIDQLIHKGVELNGTLHVPYKHGDPVAHAYAQWVQGVVFEDLSVSIPYQQERKPLLQKEGWFEFQPMEPQYMAHIWYHTMDAGDTARLQKLKNYYKHDWDKVVYTKEKDQGGHEFAWIAFLEGSYVNYPEKIMTYNLNQVYHQLHFMRSDEQDPSTYKDDYLQIRNPISFEGLLQLTMGAPRPIYNGGLLMARLRYYDGERKRPGLPEDVAALVETMTANSTIVRLINLHAMESREVIVQAGAYGEHQFIRATFNSLK